MNDCQNLNIEELLTIMEEQQTEIENLKSNIKEKNNQINQLQQKYLDSSEISKMKSLLEKLRTENKSLVSRNQNLTDKLGKVNNADLMLKELEQKQKSLNQKEASLQTYRSNYESQCNKKVKQAEAERDNALLKVEEISQQCEKDNKQAEEYKKKAKQEYEDCKKLKVKQQDIIENSAKEKVSNIKAELKAEYNLKYKAYKEKKDNLYMLHEGYHIAIAYISLMVIIYHALWLDSFRTDLFSFLKTILKGFYELFLVLIELIQYIWNWANSYDNLLAVIFGGVVLNIILIIVIFGIILFAIAFPICKGYLWLKPRFFNSETGYICVGILLFIVILADFVKKICDINLVLLLLIIYPVLFFLIYVIKGLQTPNYWSSY